MFLVEVIQIGLFRLFLQYGYVVILGHLLPDNRGENLE